MSNYKIGFENLDLIITNKCNLDCRHCYRGCPNNVDMSNEVIEEVLKQTLYIGNLIIGGGEATLALDSLEYIFNYIIKSKIYLKSVSLVINGTNYSDKLLELLDKIDEYINKFTISTVDFTISNDIYHEEALNKQGKLDIYMENLRKYSLSKYFAGRQILKPNKKLFREGNASELDHKLTVPLRKSKLYSTRVGNQLRDDGTHGINLFGPIVTINPEGIITEPFSSINNQCSEYNYGSIFDCSLEETLLKQAKSYSNKRYYLACFFENYKSSNYNR